MINNPQAVAWIIAAEGSISLLRSNNGKGVSAHINVYNTDLRFLEQFMELVDGIGHIYTRGKKLVGKKQSYEWCLSTYSECLNLLTEIYEWLPIKQEQAEIVIDFCFRAIHQGRHLSLGRYRPKPQDEDWNALELIHQFNSKGGD